MNRVEWEALAPRWLWRVVPGMTFRDYVALHLDWVMFTTYYR